VVVEGVRDRRELRDRAADRPARAGGVLHTEPEVVGTYPHREDELGCRIPEFHELPRERATFRVFATVDG
jgi:hypothetical protein